MFSSIKEIPNVSRSPVFKVSKFNVGKSPIIMRILVNAESPNDEKLELLTPKIQYPIIEYPMFSTINIIVKKIMSYQADLIIT